MDERGQGSDELGRLGGCLGLFPPNSVPYSGCERRALSEGLHRLRGADAVYLVTSVARDQRPATTDTLATVGWHVEDAWSLTAVNIVKYERD